MQQIIIQIDNWWNLDEVSYSQLSVSVAIHYKTIIIPFSIFREKTVSLNIVIRDSQQAKDYACSDSIFH